MPITIRLDEELEKIIVEQYKNKSSGVSDIVQIYLDIKKRAILSIQDKFSQEEINFIYLSLDGLGDGHLLKVMDNEALSFYLTKSYTGRNEPLLEQVKETIATLSEIECIVIFDLAKNSKLNLLMKGQ